MEKLHTMPPQTDDADSLQDRDTAKVQFYDRRNTLNEQTAMFEKMTTLTESKLKSLVVSEKESI